MGRLLEPDRANLVGLFVAGVLLAGVLLAVPRPGVQFAVGLVIFVLWMVWFVLAAVIWISNADF